MTVHHIERKDRTTTTDTRSQRVQHLRASREVAPYAEAVSSAEITANASATSVRINLNAVEEEEVERWETL